jgi:hypothetical protein
MRLLQATALVHEAYLRLFDVEKAQHWNSRGHFFAAAAEAMRRILVERARHKRRLKAGGDRQRLDLVDVEPSVAEPDDDILALDEALDKLQVQDPRKAEVVKLRFFAGLTIEHPRIPTVPTDPSSADVSVSAQKVRPGVALLTAAPDGKAGLSTAALDSFFEAAGRRADSLIGSATDAEQSDGPGLDTLPDSGFVLFALLGTTQAAREAEPEARGPRHTWPAETGRTQE